MKVTEVYFKRNFAISPLTMEHMHLAATVVVEENESPEEALKLAQKTVEDFYKKAMISVASDYDGYLQEPHEFPILDYKKLEQEEIDRDREKINEYLANINPKNIK